MQLKELVPPLELCKKIPAGEFEDSCYVMIGSDSIVQRVDIRTVSGSRQSGIYPAPTLQEILEELHKQQEDVFLKWSETAYNEWLVNAYTHNKEDYQAHDKSPATAALQVWLKMKGNEIQ